MNAAIGTYQIRFFDNFDSTDSLWFPPPLHTPGVTFKLTYTLPPPDHEAPATNHRFYVPTARLATEAMVERVLAAMGAPAIPSLAGEIFRNVPRAFSPNDRIREFTQQVNLGFVVPELPPPVTQVVFLPDEEEEEEESLDRLFNGLSVSFTPASKEAIEGLEKVTIKEPLESCAICFEDIRVGSEASRLPCLHCFHGDCIGEWLGKSKYCPLCRFEMPS